jgi:hypothetical protein
MQTVLSGWFDAPGAVGLDQIQEHLPVIAIDGGLVESLPHLGQIKAIPRVLASMAQALCAPSHMLAMRGKSSES